MAAALMKKQGQKEREVDNQLNRKLQETTMPPLSPRSYTWWLSMAIRNCSKLAIKYCTEVALRRQSYRRVYLRVESSVS